ncbi:synaptic vesicular amine transporter-like [Achroia grisella]|uniref:synaptic vesicular amine transporter-like n=1 Tax=Achroia grisella TaxID=688607 RepID=UPI0027D20333|nr:synaptic vesicular amine transporter-like [Achroia grisella]
MKEVVQSNGALAFALIYFTFFLDNVLLTVLVPIIPDWVRGESLELWTTHDAPLAMLLNSTVHNINTEDTQGIGGSQAVVGLVLGAKAASQLITAPFAGVAVCKHGPAKVLRAGTMVLAGAAMVFMACSSRDGSAGAWCAGAARVAHGAGAALAGVAGLSLAAATLPLHQRDRAIGVLLGAVALGVLIGYPFGGAAYALWSPGAPFLLLSTSLLADLVMQYMFLDKEVFNQVSTISCDASKNDLWGALSVAKLEATGACVGAILLTTSVMAALEPCLPLWIMKKFHPQRWQTGAVFIPDSVGYLIAASTLGGLSRRLGAERVAITGQIAVGLAALAVPHARSVSSLVLPHAALGGGLGAADAALVAALLSRHARRLPHLAALLQATSSVAYALGPIVGGAMSWCVGFETALRTLGVLNLLYAGFLYRTLSEQPLSEQVSQDADRARIHVEIQWGANTPDDEEESEEGEVTPLRPQIYTPLH